MKPWTVLLMTLVGIGMIWVTLGVHPISRLEAANGVVGPGYEHNLIWSRTARRAARMSTVISVQTNTGEQDRGLILFKVPLSENEQSIARPLQNGSKPIWQLGGPQHRLVISSPGAQVDGTQALEKLRARATDGEQAAHQHESKIKLATAEHARIQETARSTTLKAIDTETRKLQADLEAIAFKGTRFEAIRAVEAEAFEIKLQAETEREIARVEAESDRLRAAALQLPGSALYTALHANRQFDVSRVTIAPTSPDLIRFFGSMAIWRDFFLEKDRRDTSTDSPR